MLIKKNRQKGYTLVELIVVITVVSILAGAVSVSMNDMNETARISNAAMKVLADVRYAQELAMSTSREVNVIVNSASETYDVQWQDTGANVPDPLNNSGTLSVEFGSGDYSQIDIVSSNIGSRLSFDSFGEPRIDGSRFNSVRSIVLLNSEVHVVVYPSGYTCIEQVIGGGCSVC